MTHPGQVHSSVRDRLVEDFRSLTHRLGEALTQAAAQLSGNDLAVRNATEDVQYLISQPNELRRMLRVRAARRMRPYAEFLEWPSWDMLLDLLATRAEGGHISVSSLCISSGAPQSTALRKLAALEESRLVVRYFHGNDRRRVCLTLTDAAIDFLIAALRDELEALPQPLPTFGLSRTSLL